MCMSVFLRVGTPCMPYSTAIQLKQTDWNVPLYKVVFEKKYKNILLSVAIVPPKYEFKILLIFKPVEVSE